MQIVVFTLTGQTVTLNVEPSDTISSVLEDIRRIEYRTPADEIAIAKLMHGTTHGSPLRLVHRTSGTAMYDGTIEDLLNSADDRWYDGIEAMHVKVVVRKRLDNLNASDHQIVHELWQEYDKMVKAKGPRATAADILDQLESETPPGVSCNIDHLRFNCQMALGEPPVLPQGIHYKGLVYEAFS